MKKLIKIIGIIFGSVVAFLFAAAIAITLFFDPNDYKDEISNLVKEKTGRDFAIAGDLSLSLFPWVGIETGAVELGNAPGFGKQPFAKVEQVGVKVQVAPLFSKKLVMDTITLEGLNLNLVRKSNGTTNWQDLGGEKGKEEIKEKAEKGEASELASLDVSGVNISKANLSWDDQQAGKKFTIENLNLHTGRLGTGEPVDIKLDMTVKGSDLKKPVVVDFKSLIDLNMDKHELSVSDMVLKLADMKVTGNLQGSGFPAKPVFNGAIKTAEFVPSELLQEFGISMPATTDASVFGKAAIETKLAYTANSLKLNELVARLDDTRLEGNLAVNNFANPAISFTLDLDEIDIDRYLPPAATAKPEAGAASSDGSAELFPIKTLRSLNLNGIARIGKLKAYNMLSENISMTIKAKNGDIRIHPAKASMYQGNYSGDVRIKVSGARPVLSMNESLSGVQALPLLKDLADLKMIQGKADMSAKLTAQGNSMNALRASLNGDAKFAFLDGSIKGVNIPLMIRKAYATLKGQPAPPDEPEQTDFTELTGTAVITNGVVQNNDLKVSSPLLRIDGSGSANLVREQLDYVVKAAIISTLQGQGGEALDKLKGVSIPVRISGSFQDPKYNVQLDKVLSGAVKKEVEEKVKKKVEEEVKGKLDDELKDKFKGIFGK